MASKKKHLSSSTVPTTPDGATILAEVVRRWANGNISAADLQGLIERKPPGESSYDDKIVATFEGRGFTERDFAATTVIHGERMRRHRNGGGWVPVDQDEHDPRKPFVAETAYVGHGVILIGGARITDNAHISGRVIVGRGCTITDQARLSGNVTVVNSNIGGNAQVRDYALVTGATIFGNIVIDGYAQVDFPAVGTAHITAHITRGKTIIA